MKELALGNGYRSRMNKLSLDSDYLTKKPFKSPIVPYFQGKNVRDKMKELALVSPRGVGVECCPCNPRVSGLIPGAGNLKKVVYLDENSWTHTKTNSNRVIEFVS